MTFPSDPRSRPTAAAVVKEFKDKGIDPEGYVLYTYAAIQVWAEAATKAGTIDPKKVAAVLKCRRTWPTVLGDISYDKKGDIRTVDYVMVHLAQRQLQPDVILSFRARGMPGSSLGMAMT